MCRLLCPSRGSVGVARRCFVAMAFHAVGKAMSEQGCIYHFYLDYLNFCGPASGRGSRPLLCRVSVVAVKHGAAARLVRRLGAPSQGGNVLQSDEQNWDSLLEAQTGRRRSSGAVGLRSQHPREGAQKLPEWLEQDPSEGCVAGQLRQFLLRGYSVFGPFLSSAEKAQGQSAEEALREGVWIWPRP